ncbi:MAG: hypothetical protein COB77_05155 [Gammaproteobacteria bacterium]|nr:MAG: hypothetical protein COB77_05155 [Gammaproteobacteria bacterium]
MEMKKAVERIGMACLCCSVFYSFSLSAKDDFQQWMQQQSSGVMAQKKEFQAYKDKRDKAFTVFLKAQWKAVDIVKGNVRDEAPKPDVMPVARPEPVAPAPVSKPGSGSGVKSMPANKPVVIVVPEPELIAPPVVAPVIKSPAGKLLTIDFYGRKIHFYYDDGLRQRLSSSINKNTVSDYWSDLSKADYDGLLNQLMAQKKSLQLNDWAYVSLINALSISINSHRHNDSALLSWFLLIKSGYKVRIAYSKTLIYLLVPSEQAMFDVPYFTFSGQRYYAIDFDGEKQRPGHVYTYDGEYPNASKKLDMQVNAVVAASDQSERRHLSFTFEGKQYNVNVAYDRGRVKFFNSYPQLNLNLYFGSGVYKVTATPLQKQLAVYMQGMSEQRAVNFLLRFVQTSLKYETDEQQFGEENYLFPEETLFYPYSDCEDRAVLFTWLVKSLLNLDVVGLDYPGHVAAAVHFNDEVAGDSVSFKGKRYVITDPTYINASVGMSMPDFKRHKPTVIAY